MIPIFFSPFFTLLLFCFYFLPDYDWRKRHDDVSHFFTSFLFSQYCFFNHPTMLLQLFLLLLPEHLLLTDSCFHLPFTLYILLFFLLPAFYFSFFITLPLLFIAYIFFLFWHFFYINLSSKSLYSFFIFRHFAAPFFILSLSFARYIITSAVRHIISIFLRTKN